MDIPWLEEGYEVVLSTAVDPIPFWIELEAGDLVRIRVEQFARDVELLLTDPSNSQIARADSMSGPKGTETLIAVAEEKGVHRIEIRTFQGHGHIRLVVERRGQGTREDLALWDARQIAGRLEKEPETAIPALDEAIRTLPESTSKLEVGRLSAELALAAKSEGQLAQAARAFSEARRNLAAAGESSDWELGWLLNEWNSVLLSLGRFSLAEPSLREAIEIWIRLDFPPGLTVAFNDLGYLHHARGELSLALDAYLQAKKFGHDPQEAEDGLRLAAIHRNIAKLNQAMGQFEAAIAQLQEHMADFHEGPLDTEAVALSLLALGQSREGLAERAVTAKQKQKELDAALEVYSFALGYLGDIPPSARAFLLEQRADFFLRHGGEGGAKKAARDLEQSRELFSQDEYHLAYLNLRDAEVFRVQGELEAASVRVGEARDYFDRLGIKQGLLRAHVVKARILRQEGKEDEAAHELARARSLAETLRSSLRLESLRRSQHARRFNVYAESIDLLFAMGENERAFDVAEGTRARSLLDALAAPEKNARLLNLSAEIEKLIERRLTALKRGEHRLARNLKAEIESRENALQLEQASAMADEHARAQNAMPFTLPEIQRHLGETTLLSFTVGEERSLVFRVTADDFEVQERQGRAWMKAAVARVDEVLKGVRKGTDPRAWSAELASVARPLLGGLDLGDGPLAIIPDGELHFLPFAALPNPNSQQGRLLIEQKEIVFLPSASALVHLQRRSVQRTGADRLLGLIADPIYDPEDERLSGVELKAVGRAEDYWPRLPESAEAASKLAALVSADQASLFLGFRANHDLFRSPELSRFRWLHIATHTHLDKHDPSHMGLVVSAFDENGRRRQSLVRTDEIARLSLNAELVTLSSCESAKGEQMRGEGIVGLAQAFFTAGASRLLASLEEVPDDGQTTLFMDLFYRGLIAGDSPAKALQGAQVEMARAGIPPKTWANFVLIGPGDIPNAAARTWRAPSHLQAPQQLLAELD